MTISPKLVQSSSSPTVERIVAIFFRMLSELCPSYLFFTGRMEHQKKACPLSSSADNYLTEAAGSVFIIRNGIYTIDIITSVGARPENDEPGFRKGWT